MSLFCLPHELLKLLTLSPFSFPFLVFSSLTAKLSGLDGMYLAVVGEICSIDCTLGSVQHLLLFLQVRFLQTYLPIFCFDRIPPFSSFLTSPVLACFLVLFIFDGVECCRIALARLRSHRFSDCSIT
jgi:hypothetical protein